MQVIHPICRGIVVHAAQLQAWLCRVSEDGQITTELVSCGTTFRALIAFRTGDQLADGMDAMAVLLTTSMSSEA